MLSALSVEGVEFLVVGAYALAAHGHPRATGDMDLWVRASASNAERTWRALARFGAPMTDVSVDDFVQPSMVLQVGVAPHRIDLLTSIDGVTFDAAWKARTSAPLRLASPIIAKSSISCVLPTPGFVVHLVKSNTEIPARNLILSN